jgi:hypothetical protein
MGETPQELCRVRIRFKADSDPDLDPFSFPQCGSGFDSTDPGFFHHKILHLFFPFSKILNCFTSMPI